MSPSRKPRRAFAAPFVITLAAAPACVVSSSPDPQQPAPPYNPPGPTTTEPTDPVTPPPHDPNQPSDPVIVSNPPRPQPDPQPQPVTDRRYTVTVNASGECRAMLDVHCVPNATCNPPPPKAIACPTGITMDRPLAIVQRDTECYVEYEPPRCPTNATCNPPPPRKTACPQ